MRDLTIYQCISCFSALTAVTDGSAVCCATCGARYPLLHNILDTLVDPCLEVIQELRANAREQGLPPEEWQSFKVHRITQPRDLDTRLKRSAGEPVQYYQQTTTNFNQAMLRLGSVDSQQILEIGADYDYYFLRHFRDMNADCYAANVRFSFAEPDEFLRWPEKTLADMNRLPFRDEVFDVVLLSATSHHSSDLEHTVREVARIVKRGGLALFLNDPLKGWLKWMGGPVGRDHHDRDEEIHENEYSISTYHRAFLRAGLKPEYLFSEFHNQKLRNADIHPEQRFASLGRILSTIWRNERFRRFAIRNLLWTAQAVFGFPLNVILRKAR
jgi:SAM-dependent methyltransferase